MAMEFEPGSAAAIGRAMYDEIRDEMEQNYWGWMVVIDIHSGDYEIGDDDITTTMRLLERRPHAYTWGELVGFETPYSFNGAPRERAPSKSPWKRQPLLFEWPASGTLQENHRD